MDEQARQDLELVRRLMVDARGAERGHGPHMVLWGVVVAVALLLTWAFAAGHAMPAPPLIWGVALAGGWLGSMVLGMRSERGRVTTGGRLLAHIWIGTAVTLTLAGLGGLFADAFSPRHLPGLTSLIMGGGFWGTAAVTGSRAERWLAVAWWLGGAVLLVWSWGAWALLIQAGMVIAFEVVPGVVLLRRARAEAPVSDAGREPALR